MIKFWQSKKYDLLALLGLVFAPLVLFFPVTLGERVFAFGDIMWQNLPIRAEVTRALAQGRLPLWTPLLQAGLPLFAEAHTSALYPVGFALHLLMPPYLAISDYVLFHIVWAAVGMYLLARACGLRVSSAFVAGIAFAGSGAMLARVPHLDVTPPMAWLPWMIFFQARYWQTRVKKQRALGWFLLCAGSIGLQLLAGSPAVTFRNFALYGVLGLLGALIWTDALKIEWKKLFSIFSERAAESLVVTVGSLLLGFGIGAVQWIPTAELASFSTRGDALGIAFFTTYSLNPAALTQFIAPFASLFVPDAVNMEYWGYFSVLALMLAFLAPILRRDFRTWFFVAMAIVALVLALGDNTPIYGWLYFIPIFNRFRAPARLLFFFLLASTLLAGMGFDALQDRLSERGANKRAEVVLSLGLMTSVLIALVVAYFEPLEFWLSVWRWLPIGLLALSLGILLAAWLRKASRPVFQIVVIGMISVDLTLFSAPFLTTIAATFTPSDLAQVPRTVLAMDNAEPIGRSIIPWQRAISLAAGRAVMVGNMPMTYGKAAVVAGAVSYIPIGLDLDRNERYIQGMTLAMRNLMNIRYYLLPLEFAPPEQASPLDDAQPADGLALDLLRTQPRIPATRAAQVRIVSYTDQTTDLPNGYPVGEIDLALSDGSRRVVPLRLGVDTADWAYDGLASLKTIQHTQPTQVLDFPAYLRSVGHTFTGHRYVAMIDLGSPVQVVGIGADSYLPEGRLAIEHIDLIDDSGKSVSLASLLQRNDLALAFRGETALMWDNRDVTPRAFVVHAAENVDDAQVLERMKSEDFRPTQTVFLSDAPANAIQSMANGSATNDRVSFAEYTADRAWISVSTAAAGYVVLTDSWYPGWEATVDGVAVPIYRADYIFRAVQIPAGVHEIRFEYRPMTFMMGGVISLASLGLMVVLALDAYRRRELHQPNASAD